MNCCDEYGNCRQGRDCPIRKNRDHGNPLKPADGEVLPWLAGALLALVWLLVSVVYILA